MSHTLSRYYLIIPTGMVIQLLSAVSAVLSDIPHIKIETAKKLPSC